MISTLRFRSSFGSHATAQNADGCWTFKRMGFFKTRETVRACNSETEIAGFRDNTWKGGGTLEFQDASGAPLIRYKNEGILHTTGRVHIEPRALEMPELSWLINFGWYVAVMVQLDHSSATAIPGVPTT